MIGTEGFDEVVLLFEEDLSAVAEQMLYRDFEELVQGRSALARFAASRVKAVYVVVGDKLSVRAAVFFYLPIDEEGKVDARFNVPLRYLAGQAGAGPDVGSGSPIRLACRGHCPVPWHQKDLWEPSGVGDVHPATRVQKIIWRNRLGLKSRKMIASVDFNGDEIVKLQQKLEQKVGRSLKPDGALDLKGLLEGHSEQIEQVTRRYQVELSAQQEAYNDRLRRAEAEIQKLRSALKSEKRRNRRLQEMLRGEQQ